MSGHIIEAGQAWVPLAVVGASLAGSAHCAGMCGGLVASGCRSGWDWIGYQLGRLVAYAGLGALAGWAGQSMLSESAVRWVPWAAAISMALGFVALGVKSWRGEAPHLAVVPTGLLTRAHRALRGTPPLLGALSAALPCGWLQSFVLASASTQHPASGAALMSVFWVGTLPALYAAPWAAGRLLGPARARAPRVTAILLILAGVGGLGLKMNSLLAAGGEGAPAPHCHDEGAPHGTAEPSGRIVTSHKH